MIKILGSFGNRVANGGTTSFLLDEEIAIDAGNLSKLGKDVIKLNHIFISHSHFDHIADLPFVIDTLFSERKETLKIYGLKETLNQLQNIFNNKIWPDFRNIKLLNNKASVEFIEIQTNQTIKLKNFTIKFIYANHTVANVGFKITKNNKTIIISSDTYLNDKLIKEVNKDDILFLECSFPSYLENLAKTAKHLTPNLIKSFIDKIKTKNIFFYHFKYEYKDEIIKELFEKNIISNINQILEDDETISFKKSNTIYKKNTYSDAFYKLAKIGVELSTQQNIDYLLEDILSIAREFTNADAGSVYFKNDDKLYFKIIQNDTLNIFMGGRNESIKWNPLNLKDKNMVAVLSAVNQQVFNIEDVYLDK